MPEPLRVLFIGNPTPDAAVLSELERGGYLPESGCAAAAGDLVTALEQKWDIAIAVEGAGDAGLTEALEGIRARGIDLPVIVIATPAGYAEVREALQAGAADHLDRAGLGRLTGAVARELRAVALRRQVAVLEDQFRQAQKMEAVGQMAGGVAHDFNNLLTVISGYSDLLLSGGDLKTSQRTALEEIRRSAERGGDLTYQLLAFARRSPRQTRQVCVNDLIIQFHELVRRIIGDHITVVTLPKADPDTVEADPRRLEQVVMNLVMNARDAMPGGGTLTLETTSVEVGQSVTEGGAGLQPGPYVLLAITDTGIGMDAETLSHVFEPYFTTKGPGRGTGLGLVTAMAIVRQAGGTIRIASRPRQGSIARVYLPLVRADVPYRETDVDPEPRRGTEKVLVVEDDAHVRKVVVAVLESRGYCVLEAARGPDAVRLSLDHKGSIDLILTDLVMPGTSGPEVARLVQAQCPKAHVLYMSGYADEAEVHYRISESGAAFLAKPFLPSALARKVREVLDAGAGDRAQGE